MNAICICGSPNKAGSTSLLLSELARGMRDAGLSVATYFLSETEIGFCLGCNTCRKGLPCTLQDGMRALTAALIDADIVCIGSPSYWGDVPAQLKAFFDRSTPLCDTLPGGTTVPPGKLGVSVALRAGRNAAESLHLLDTIDHYYGHLGIRPVARLHAEGIDSPADILSRPDLLHWAYDVGFTIQSRLSNRSDRSEFTLRSATDADISELAKMNFALIRDEGSQNPMMIPELEQRLSGFIADGYNGVVICVAGDAAGYCLWRNEDGPHGTPPGVYIRQYYIKPEYRRNGLGKAALREILSVRLAGAAFVSLDVLECNTAGRAFWSDFGFRPVYSRMSLTL